jgi:hypothetical protein
MTESKKARVEPELIVLVRSKPEEGVLSACKTKKPGVGYASYNDACTYGDFYDCDQRCIDWVSS